MLQRAYCDIPGLCELVDCSKSAKLFLDKCRHCPFTDHRPCVTCNIWDGTALADLNSKVLLVVINFIQSAPSLTSSES